MKITNSRISPDGIRRCHWRGLASWVWPTLFFVGYGCGNSGQGAVPELTVSQVLPSIKGDRRVTLVLGQPVSQPRLHLSDGSVLAPVEHRGSVAVYELPVRAGKEQTKARLEARDVQERQIVASAALDISVDNLAPTTTVTPLPGKYDQAVVFQFRCSEPSTIYYTINGDTPSQQGLGLPCDGTTESITVATSFALQYFGVDGSGNAEPVRGGSYLVSDAFFSVPATLQVEAGESSFEIQISGAGSAGIVYAIGQEQCASLERAAKAQLPPPLGLPIRESLISGAFDYRSMYGGAIEGEVCFGLVAQPQVQKLPIKRDPDEEPVPGTPPGSFLKYPVSAMPVIQFVRLEGGSAPPFQSDLERFSRGVYWLASQPPTKALGAAASVFQLHERIIPTNENGKDTPTLSRILIRNAIRLFEHRIRTQRVRDVGEMAERILALHNHNKAPIQEVVDLVLLVLESDGTVTGWGVQADHHPDVFHTALGILATGKFLPEFVVSALSFFQRSEFLGQEGYGWVAHQPRDLGVSALVYRVVDAPKERYQWILDAIDEGSFGSIRSMATVLRFLGHQLPAEVSGDSPIATLEAAKNELVSHQGTDGSWNQDPELTAQALLGLGQYLCIQETGKDCEGLGANQ